MGRLDDELEEILSSSTELHRARPQPDPRRDGPRDDRRRPRAPHQVDPTFATETAEECKEMKRERRRFLADYRVCLERWNGGERDVVFPAGTVRMRLRHNVPTEPIPLDLLLAG